MAILVEGGGISDADFFGRKVERPLSSGMAHRASGISGFNAEGYGSIGGHNDVLISDVLINGEFIRAVPTQPSTTLHTSQSRPQEIVSGAVQWTVGYSDALTVCIPTNMSGSGIWRT